MKLRILLLLGLLFIPQPILADRVGSIDALLGTAVVFGKQGGVFNFYYCYNPNSSAAYLQFYDASPSVTTTPGTTAHTGVFGLPATGGGNAAVMNLNMSNGLKFAATTTATGASAVSSAITCTFGYTGEFTSS